MPPTWPVSPCVKQQCQGCRLPCRTCCLLTLFLKSIPAALLHCCRDTTELQLISATADKPAGTVLERLASHPLVDVSDVIFDADSRQPEALALDYHKPVWSFASQEAQQDWQRLEGWRPGEVAEPVSKSRDSKVSMCAGCCCSRKRAAAPASVACLLSLLCVLAGTTGVGFKMQPEAAHVHGLHQLLGALPETQLLLTLQIS